MKAREIMTSNPECLTPDAPISRAAELMRELNVGAIPVVSDESSMRLTGLITDRDITTRHTAEGHDGSCTVGDHMTSGSLDCVQPEADVNEVMRLMEREQIRRVPVVEEGDRLVGIIAQADLATKNVDDASVGRVVEGISEPGRPER
jgi:CBS domain-containing protein